MALNTYGHVIEELEGADVISAESTIRQARGQSGISPLLDEVARDPHLATGAER